MSRTDKTSPSFVKALRREGATISHDHRDGVCNLGVHSWWGPRRDADWGYHCDIYVDAYSYPGSKEWPRPRSVKWETKKWHRAARRSANVELARGEEPEPLRTRRRVLWDTY
jgi:hypothetical protein